MEPFDCKVSNCNFAKKELHHKCFPLTFANHLIKMSYKLSYNYLIKVGVNGHTIKCFPLTFANHLIKLSYKLSYHYLIKVGVNDHTINFIKKETPMQDFFFFLILRNFSEYVFYRPPLVTCL